MGALLAGAVALALVVWLLRALAQAPVAAVRKGLAWVGAGLAVALAVAMLLAGRGAQALWALAFVLPMAWRAWQRRNFSAGTAPAAGQASTVETGFLAMRLDHASGEMTGRVRQGGFAGRELAELSREELLALLAECRAADADSVPLLEAWLDRTWPDWRGAQPPPQPPPPPGHTGMDRAEALAVLGLAEGAAAEDIRAAHRRLMQAAHPDHGGSDWLASRVNQARDALLRD